MSVSMTKEGFTKAALKNCVYSIQQAKNFKTIIQLTDGEELSISSFREEGLDGRYGVNVGIKGTDESASFVYEGGTMWLLIEDKIGHKLRASIDSLFVLSTLCTKFYVLKKLSLADILTLSKSNEDVHSCCDLEDCQRPEEGGPIGDNDHFGDDSLGEFENSRNRI